MLNDGVVGDGEVTLTIEGGKKTHLKTTRTEGDGDVEW